MEAHEFKPDLHEFKPEPKPRKHYAKILSRFWFFLIAHPPIAIIILIVVILFSLSLVIGYQSYATSRMVRFGLENVGELVTQSGYFMSVQVIENAHEIHGWKIPFTTTKCIFSYDGTISAGIDFTQIDVDTDEAKKEIHVSLPEVEIFSIEVNPESMKIYDESKSIFTPLSISDMNNSLEALQEEVRTQAIENGLLENAKANAITLIQGMISGSFDTSKYTFFFDA